MSLLSIHLSCAAKGGGDSGWTGKVLAPQRTPRVLRHSTTEALLSCTESLDSLDDYALFEKSRVLHIFFQSLTWYGYKRFFTQLSIAS